MRTSIWACQSLRYAWRSLRTTRNHGLQAQLEGTENRIAVARNRYITSVQDYNVAIRSFPSNLTAMVFGYAVKANFTVTDEKALAAPPAVSFGASGAKTLIPSSPGSPK